MDRELIVLSVEDNSDDQLILAQAFRRAGLPTALRTVGDGDEAANYVLGTGAYEDRSLHPLPSLILLDLKLPRKSGHEVLGWLRARPELRHVPVLALTSSGEPSDIRRAYDLGITSYFVKPTGFEEMVALVKCLTTYWLLFNRRPV